MFVKSTRFKRVCQLLLSLIVARAEMPTSANLKYGDSLLHSPGPLPDNHNLIQSLIYHRGMA